MENYLLLQEYWYFLVSLLGALLVFLFFVQGGQTLIYSVAKSEVERSIVINTLGRKWEFTFTTLVTFGGAFFASFPLFYATSFGGAYWVWIIILFSFVIQAVSYEFRTKANNFLGQKTYEVFLILNGVIGTLFIGAAVGTFFNGAEFELNSMNQTTWKGFGRGLEAVLDFSKPSSLHNLLLGLSVLTLSRVLGLLYILNSVEHAEIEKRSTKALPLASGLFLLFFLSFVIWLFLKDGYGYDPITYEVSLVPFKYFHNLYQSPLVGLTFVSGVVLVLVGLAKAMFTGAKRGAIWYAGIGTVLTVLGLFLCAGYNNTAFYPSSYDLQSSLTIQNASSSEFTLTIMSYVSIIIPFVLGYIWYVWKAMNKERITKEEVENDPHLY